MRRGMASALLVGAVATVFSSPGLAERRTRLFHIPASPLADAVVALGEQAGVTIGFTGAVAPALRVGAVQGRMTAQQALDRLLAETDLAAVQVGGGAYRISPQRKLAGHAKPQRAQPGPPHAMPQIIVTGSKRGMALSSYPGSAIVIGSDRLSMRDQAEGSEALVSLVPLLSSTELGPGQNKLFIRGVADSSFNGPTQATVGEYLGDARLNYNAPDPDLALYDLASVEIIEGPQGTLYGAGTLGGIIRLVPNMPSFDGFQWGASGGVSATHHGAPGYDVAALVNIPILDDRVAARALAYRTIDGGYIDDPSRGRTDINLAETQGGRAVLRLKPASDWTIDITGVLQDINTRDSQYAQRNLPPLERSSTLAQPFDNDYALGGLVVRHAMGSSELISSTSLVHHDLASDYDASDAAGPRLFREDDKITLVSNETRIEHNGATGLSWVSGVELLYSSDRITRSLGPPDRLVRITGTRNDTREAALFGEVTWPLTQSLSITGGGRLGFSDLQGSLLDQPEAGAMEQSRTETVFLPSAGLLWKAADRLSLYARFQQGYRAGGIAVAAGAVSRFKADSLATVEAGVRYGHADDRLRATIAISHAHWEDIQADLIDQNGLPITANIGTGAILAFEAQAAWRPWKALRLNGALFVNRSRLSAPAPGFGTADDATLPNIAACGAEADAGYDWSLGAESKIGLSASVRYQGKSRLGVGPILSLPQGDYTDARIGVRWSRKAVAATVDISNLLDAGRNIFALGNPFGVTTGDQITPMRPRTIRLGISYNF